jgi:hypothetical protein
MAILRERLQWKSFLLFDCQLWQKHWNEKRDPRSRQSGVFVINDVSTSVRSKQPSLRDFTETASLNRGMLRGHAQQITKSLKKNGDEVHRHFYNIALLHFIKPTLSDNARHYLCSSL